MPDQVERRKGLTHDKYERLVKAAQAQCTIKVAVVHPCDDVSLEGAVQAARLGLIEPISGRPGGAHPRRRPACRLGHCRNGDREFGTQS